MKTHTKTVCIEQELLSEAISGTDSSSSSSVDEDHTGDEEESEPVPNNDMAIDHVREGQERTMSNASSEPKPLKKLRSSRLVRLLVPKTEEELQRLKREGPEEYQTHPLIARKVARVCLVLCSVDSAIALFASVGWFFSETGTASFSLWITWIAYRFLIAVKGFLNQLYFLREEIDDRKFGLAAGSLSRSTTTSVRPLNASSRASRHSTRASESSVSLSTLRSPSLDQDALATPPLRRDTENNIGLLPIRRPTYPLERE